MTLDPNRWTLKTQEALRDAIALAKDSHHAEVGADHLLSAALSQDGGVAIPLLDRLGIAPLSVRNKIAESLARIPKAYGTAEPSLEPRALGGFRARRTRHAPTWATSTCPSSTSC